ncbi:MAG: hypothetical protein WC495_05270 [Patescibacteria group bacterium]
MQKWSEYIKPYKERRKGLRPGMRVRNTVSDNKAVLIADRRHPKKLAYCADFCVMVSYRIRTGRFQGRLKRTFWHLDHVKVLS